MTAGQGPRSAESRMDGPSTDSTTAGDAFSALGNETRMAVVRALADAEALAFSELYDRTGEDTSAGFAYHLRQLTGRFVRQRGDERYELTDAGRAVARAVRAGTYTESVDRDPLTLDENCPFCGAAALVATVTDNVTEIACGDCERALLELPFPPSGYAGREDADLPAAFDAHHRRRIGAFGDGVCPVCAGTVDAHIEPVGDLDDDFKRVDGRTNDGRNDEPEGHVPVQLCFDCETCGADLRCPVSLAVLDHPAVVAFYRDHGREVSDQPIWNVGSEWRERVVSRDPWCVLVSVRLDGEDLLLYLAGDGTVVDHRRVGPDDDGVGDPGPSANASASGADTTAPDESVGDDPADDGGAADSATA